MGAITRNDPQLGRASRRRQVREFMTDLSRDPARATAWLVENYRTAIIGRVGVACLSEVPDDLLMWAHYADSHRGVCFQFDSGSEFLRDAMQVTYQRSRPLIDPTMDTPNEMLERGLLTKSEHWKYEREWRLIAYRSGPGSYVFPHSTLTGVILGAQISKDDAAMVAEWGKKRQPALAILQASLSRSQFGIEIHPAA